MEKIKRSRVIPITVLVVGFGLMASLPVSAKDIKVDPDTLVITTLAKKVPVGYGTIGSYPPVEFLLPMYVDEGGL